jgi:hypothetical protein
MAWEIIGTFLTRNNMIPQFSGPAVNTVFGVGHLHHGSSQMLYFPYLGTRTVIV